MYKIISNLNFSVSEDTHRLLCNGRLTQIRLISATDDLMKALIQCCDTKQFFIFLKQYTQYLQIAPVGIIGPKEASQSEYIFAEKLGQSLADLGLPIICGGRNGVMEAVCKGVHQHGGMSIGLIPSGNLFESNHYVKQIITTNMGPTRNSLIALSAFSLIAIGGGMGTLSEIAYGLHYGKPVFITSTAPYVEGVVLSDNLDEIITLVIAELLNFNDD
ncbi:TIGR00725 family protein [Acinetobacter sp. B5B]|nr:TIGR00725 family protein [Acinetobacter baretiae]